MGISNWGGKSREVPHPGHMGVVVSDDKVVRPKASSKESCRIAPFKEQVKNHLNNVLSEALLGEENIRAHLPPLSNTVFSDRTILIRSQATLAKEHSPSPPLVGKGKKPRREAAMVYSNLVSPPRFPLWQSSKVVKVCWLSPVVPTQLPTSSIHPSNPP